MYLTYRYRVKDRHAKHLDEMARSVNLVWNFCGETQEHARRWSKKWPSRFDLIKLTSGCAADLGLSSWIVEAICSQFILSRDRARRRPRWRGKRSLGWVPFRDGAVKIMGDSVVCRKRRLRLWYHRPIGGEIRGGCFSRDAAGRWYANLLCEIQEAEPREGAAIGVDLGLKVLATCSDGAKVENPRHFHRCATKLATAQRAGRKRRARAIYRKVANARRDHLHKASTSMARSYAKIVVGNISPTKLMKTKFAKSVSDAGWSQFRDFLRYKAIKHGGRYEERSERLTTRTCSDCGSISGPKGREGLVVREWRCSDCGAVHDRDVNSAINILGPECRPPRAGSGFGRGHYGDDDMIVPQGV